MYGFYYFDYYYIVLVLPAVILSMVAQIKVNSTFKKYSTLKNSRAITGADAALRVLRNNGITNVNIERVSGNLTDHYDPSSNVIRLSDAVYNSTSVSAIGVAAHEAGHAVQNQEAYLPIKIRQAMVPVTQFSSRLSIPLIIIGLFLPAGLEYVVYAGIILFSVSVLFEIITLPVEFDASKRAIKALEESDILYGEELKGAKKVLSAAAMTYLAAMLTSLMSLLRLILISNSRRRD